MQSLDLHNLEGRLRGARPYTQQTLSKLESAAQAASASHSAVFGAVGPLNRGNLSLARGEKSDPTLVPSCARSKEPPTREIPVEAMERVTSKKPLRRGIGLMILEGRHRWDSRTLQLLEVVSLPLWQERIGIQALVRLSRVRSLDFRVDQAQHRGMIQPLESRATAWASESPSRSCTRFRTRPRRSTAVSSGRSAIVYDSRQIPRSSSWRGPELAILGGFGVSSNRVRTTADRHVRWQEEKVIQRFSPTARRASDGRVDRESAHCVTVRVDLRSERAC
jgi:hypothetical protein